MMFFHGGRSGKSGILGSKEYGRKGPTYFRMKYLIKNNILDDRIVPLIKDIFTQQNKIK